MNPPPPESVFASLKSKPVEGLFFGAYVMNLHFEDDARLSIYAPFRFGHQKWMKWARLEELPIKQTKLLRLIGQFIIQVEHDADGSLTMLFDKGDVLIVYANDPMYEAYIISSQGQEHIV